MADKWTMGSNNEGLYNGVRPPEEGDRKKKRKKDQEIITVASGRIQSKGRHFI